MGIANWFAPKKKKTPIRSRVSSKGFHPGIEFLEDRLVPSSEFPASTLIIPNAVAGQLITDPNSGTPGNVVVFNFQVNTAFNANPQASDFSALVTLGDGSSVTLTSAPTSYGDIVADGSGFDVVLNYTYQKELTGNFGVQVTDLTTGKATSATDTSFVVEDAPILAGTPASISAVKEVPFSAQVATFSDSNLYLSTSDFTATVNWGDGTSSTGTISALGDGDYQVNGSHTYTEESGGNPYAVTVTIDDDGGGSTTVTGSAAVTVPAVVATGVPVSAVKEIPFSGTTIATFTDPAGAESLADYSITSINWGDGSPLDTSSGAISGPDGQGVFTVTGGHTYAEEGTYTITVTIDHEGLITTQTTTATVGVQGVAVTGVPVSAVKEEAFSGTTIATFTDPAGAESLADYSVTSINWGDGSPLDTSSGAISGPSSGIFTVTGGHTYAEEGTYTITVTIDHEGVITTQTTTATVGVQAVVATGVPVSAVKEIAFSGTTIATFTDPAGAESLADYSITSINWGDGSPLDTSSGAISGPDGQGVFTVTGGHTYAEEGTYTVTVTIDHEGVITTQTTTATVNVQAVVATGVPVNAVKEIPFSGTTIATFTDPAGAESLADYSITSINWGDGSPLDTSSGAISGPDGQGVFTVTGGHTYAEEGTYTITVTIDHEGVITTQTTTATVGVQGVAVTGVPVSAVKEEAFSGTTIATFTDPAGAESLADYSVTSINWGDGSPLDTSSGAISGPSSGIFTVTGGHTYAEEGTYTITVTIDHEGVITTQTTTATVGVQAVVATGVPVSAVKEIPFSGTTIATFTDPAGAESLADYSVTSINWGDGSPLDTSSGAISGPDGQGVFTVTGGHTYAEEGTYTITVTIDHEGVITTQTTTATVGVQAVVATGVPVSAVKEIAFSGTTIATFTDPAGAESLADYSITSINWGDGSPLDTSSGAISGPSSGVFTVTGGHTYAEEGTYTITVTIDHEGVITTQTTTATVIDPALVATGFTISATAGTPFTGQKVATFTDPGGAEPVSDYSASINWGDGTSSSSGTISVSGGIFTVVGGHTYANSGVYTVTVTIDPGATTTTVTDTANVVADPVNPAAEGEIATCGSTASQFANGKAAALPAVCYSLDFGGHISQCTSPGTFYYYSFVTAPASGKFTISISESNNSTNKEPAFLIDPGQIHLYNATGTTLLGSGTDQGNGEASITANASAAEQVFIVSIEYTTQNLVGAAGPKPSILQYTWTTTVGGVTQASAGLELTPVCSVLPTPICYIPEGSDPSCGATSTESVTCNSPAPSTPPTAPSSPSPCPQTPVGQFLDDENADLISALTGTNHS